MRQLEQTITTLEIAEMMEAKHWQILRKLDGTKKTKGIIKILGDNKIVVTDYFIKSTYQSEQGKEMPCYKVTKLGCDFLANKFSGEKGIIFTARYVKRFADMEQHIASQMQPALSEPTPFDSWNIAKKPEKGKWFNENNWKLKIILDRFGWTRKFLYHKILSELSDLYNLSVEEKAYTLTHGHAPEYKLDLLDHNKKMRKTATDYINYLLTEEGENYHG